MFYKMLNMQVNNFPFRDITNLQKVLQKYIFLAAINSHTLISGNTDPLIHLETVTLSSQWPPRYCNKTRFDSL